MSTENVFNYFYNVPQEIRMMMIDEMQPEDRCRFTRCSKQSRREARISKKLIQSLSIVGDSENSICIHVQFIDYRRRGLYAYGFILKFETDGRKKYLTYVTKGTSWLTSYQLWRTEVCGSTNLFEYSLRQFKRALKIYQNITRTLIIRFWPEIGNRLENFDFGVRSLNNLEELRSSEGIDISQFILRVRKPLKIFEHLGGTHNILQNCEQVYQVRDLIRLPQTSFNNQQILQFTAPIFTINIGDLTVEDIFNFIKLWQTGQLRDNFETCSWVLDDSDFDAQQLLSLFEVENIEDSRIEARIWIIQEQKDGKSGVLCHYKLNNKSLSFRVQQ